MLHKLVKPKANSRASALHGLVFLILGLVAFGLMGCEDPLEVENPNSLLEKDLDNPIAAAGVVSGALGTTAQGVAYVLAPYEAVTDEVTWIGSRNAWNDLNRGKVTDIQNEFVDNAMKFMHEGRWMSDKAVQQMEKFDREEVLEDRSLLSKAYLLSGVIRIYIADWFDDWAFSNKTEPAPAVGKDNMFIVYDDAIERLTKAIDVARQAGNQELEARALAARARAKHAKAVWQLLNPPGQTPANPLVNAGADDAAATLALVDDNWRWQFFYGVGREWNDLAWQINGRKELAFVANLPDDPIDGGDDPRVTAAVAEFTDVNRWGGTNYSPVTVVSAREMHLIIAEAKLASGDEAGAKAELNIVRALDGLTPLNGQITTLEMLIHERRANLFLQGRRLNDMYRFGIKDPEWDTTSPAYQTPGLFLPITISERLANPLIPISD